MTFRLLKKTTGRVNTTFHITDAAGTVIGSVNVPRGQENDLQKCWRDSAPAAAAPAQARAARAMAAALRRGPRMDKAAILRGS